MTNKNLHEDSSCPVDQDVLEVSTEEILDEGEQNPENGFSSFSFSKELIQTLSDKGYSSPTPIQKAAVFPVPVCACPTKSLPRSNSGIAAF